MASTTTTTDDLFSSAVSDIKSYSGEDPLLPWLRGIKRMKECLSPHMLEEKLPRFLQKCAQKFVSERRYRNDLRYLRVWIHLMDYVDDPGVVLKEMVRNQIGMKWSLFYQAYALYYEKNKKFEEAEKIYHMGVQNLAEPMDELKKSYELFVRRMDRHMTKRIQRQRRTSSNRTIGEYDDSLKGGCHGESLVCGEQKDTLKILEEKPCDQKPVDMVVEKSRAHMPVDPTISAKEGLGAAKKISTEPTEAVAVSKGSQRGHQNENKSSNNKLEVFVDQHWDAKCGELEEGNIYITQFNKVASVQPQEEGFKMYIDDEGSGEESSNSKLDQLHNTGGVLTSTSSDVSAFVFPVPKDSSSENSNELGGASSSREKFREVTVVRKFVGSIILDDEPVVENVCHHGLVDPTVNLKQAMDEINNMFGKPMEFVRKRRSKKQDEEQVDKGDIGAFVILPDDDLDDEPVPASSREKASGNLGEVGFSILPDHEEDHKGLMQPHAADKSRERDLFEPTIFTKEAMDDINKMFAMPLDF